MEAEYYCNMLEADVFPKIGGMLPVGEHFRRKQDWDGAHTDQYTREFSGNNNLTTIPWVPIAGHLSLPDLYVNPKIKHRLKEHDLSTTGGLMAELTRALGEMGKGASFLGGLRM